MSVRDVATAEQLAQAIETLRATYGQFEPLDMLASQPVSSALASLLSVLDVRVVVQPHLPSDQWVVMRRQSDSVR